MKERLALICLSVSVGFSPVVACAELLEEEGNILLIMENGERRQITATGLDYDPCLSPHGKKIVFVRKRLKSGNEADVEGNDIWIIDTDGENEKKIVEGRENSDKRMLSAGLHSPVFSSDGGRIYFMSRGRMITDAIHVVDLDDLSTQFVTFGNSLKIIHQGEYKDHLIVSKHKYFIGGGSYDWYWLLTPDADEVGPIGPSTKDFNLRYGLYCINRVVSER